MLWIENITPNIRKISIKLLMNIQTRFKSNHELELNSYKVTIIVTIELNVNSIHYSM